MTTYWAEQAWLGGQAAVPGVLLEVAGDRFAGVVPGVPAPPGAVRLPGLTLPGLVDAHSHAFHRALRGRTQTGRGSFWTWREAMYAVAGRLTPQTLLDLARAAFAESALAGTTTVGEFAYVHARAGGVPYDDPNLLGQVLAQAAAEAGVRLTLLDTCYLAGGFGQPLSGVQQRFGDGTALAWAERVDALRDGPALRIGAAVHSVRAVPADELSVVAAWAESRAAPLHVHLSEQPAEDEACLAATGRTPTQLLADSGVLGPRTTAVHATHVTAADAALLGRTGTGVCLCPTTERDLADGIGPAGALAAAGCALSVGSDSRAVVDLLEEVRAVELDERLASRVRGRWSAPELLAAATAGGAAALGWPEAGCLEQGALADLVSVRLDGVRTAGAGPALEATVFAAGAADVAEVVVGGRHVVSGGRHLLVDDVPGALARAVQAVLP